MDTLRANSRRVDLLFVYTVHTQRMTNTKAKGLSVKEMLDTRRRERNDQDCYPLPLVAFQLMEIIEPLDEAVFGHIKSQVLIPQCGAGHQADHPHCPGRDPQDRLDQDKHTGDFHANGCALRAPA
jgi:hypothetical protein